MGKRTRLPVLMDECHGQEYLPMPPHFLLKGLDEKHAGFFENLLERAEEFGGGCAIDDSVVGAEGGGENRSGDDLILANDGALFGRADGEDGDFGRVDDGAELPHAVGAETRDAECRLALLFAAEALGAG